MKIKKIEIHNFKGTKRLELEPGKINAIVGPNGVGKTTILEAIKTGINGKPPAAHIMSGSAGAKIELDIDGVGTIQREWVVGKPAKTRLNNRTTTQTSVNQTIEANFGFSSATTEIMSSAEVVEKLFGENFAKYLLNFLKNDMDINKLIALCSPSPEAEKELRMMMPDSPETISLDDVEETYDYYRNARTEATRSLDIYRKKAAYSGIIPTHSPAELSEMIARLSEKAGAAAAMVNAYNTAVANSKKLQTQLSSLKKDIAELNGVKKPTPMEIENLKIAIQQAKEVHSTALADMRNHSNQNAALRKILCELNTPVCPISGKLVCTTDKTSVKAEIEEQIDLCLRLFEDAKGKSESAVKTLKDLEAKMTETIRRDEAYKRKIALLKQLEQAESVKIEIPNIPDASSAEALRVQLEELKKEYRLAVQYEEAKEAEKLAEHTEAAVNIFNEIIELLSPKGGARRKILEHNLTPLETYCNTKARRILPKYNVKIDVSNGFRMSFSDMSGNLVPYEAISNGERIRALYILMDMLNALNGFRILLLDDLEGLDTESFVELLKIIEENESDYDHVFISMVSHGEFVEELKKKGRINLIEIGS